MSIFYSGDEEYGDDITSGLDNTLEDRSFEDDDYEEETDDEAPSTPKTPQDDVTGPPL